MQLRRNILIFHSGALGDFIVTWPLALALARLHPQSRVFYVTQGQKGALAEKVLRVESLDLELGGWHRLFGQKSDLPAPAASALAGAHTVISFLSSPSDPWFDNVRSSNREAEVIGINPTAPDSLEGHQSQLMCDQLSAWPAAKSAATQILRSVEERGLGGAPSASGPVIIHPGGGAPAKCWAAERCLELGQRLAAAGIPVCVLLGEVELERWPTEQIARYRNALEVKTPATLVELHEIIRGGRAFIGNDSGPGHLAGILGLPTLSLFGAASRPARWKPLGPRVSVLHHPLESLSVDAVRDTMKSLL